MASGYSRKQQAHGSPAGEEEFELALKYEKGDDVEQDWFEAAEHLQQAVALNHTGAMVELGKALLHGCGVKRSVPKALELFRKAESMGNTDALVELGLCHKRGIGMKANANEALELFTQAAKQGNGEAMFHLGSMLFLWTGCDRRQENWT